MSSNDIMTLHALYII